MTIGSYAIVIDGELVEASDVYVNGKTADLRAGRSESYMLVESDETADETAAEHWRNMDVDELVGMLGAEKIAELWAAGTSLEDYISENVTADDEFGSGDTSLDVTGMLEYVKHIWPELVDWINGQDESCGSDYSALSDWMAGDEEEDAEDKARVIELLMGWQELVDDIGFEPTVAYKN